MNIQKYLAFLKVVEYGSFTIAAEKLQYSQSGISHMIKDLEKEWNISLLERDRSGVRITSDGLKILPIAQSICEEYQKLQMQLDDINGLQSGMIRIGSFSSPATHWLPNIIQHFKKDYPNIEFQILLGSYTEIESWLLHGQIDCAFLLLPTQNDFDTIFLEEDSLLAVLPKQHPLANLDTFPISALEEYPFMLSKIQNDSEVLDFLNHHNLHPQISFTSWDDYVLMSMIEKGLGIGILSGLILKKCPFQIIKKELSIPARRNIGFVMRDQEKAPLAVKRFCEYLPFRHPQ